MADTIASLMIVIDAAQAALAAAKMDDATRAAGSLETQVKKVGDTSKAAAAGMAAIPAALRDIDARTDALRASVDPLALAQKKANKELAEAASLYRLGAISAQEYANYGAVLEGRLETITSAQNALNMAQGRGTRQMGLTAQESLNLSRQIADVGVSLASGQALWMVAIQQGAQLGDIYQTASARGVTFSAMIGTAGRQIGGFVARVAPAAALLAAAGAAIALPWKVAAEEIEDSSERIARSLGATETQMKRIKEEGVGMGDTLVAVFEVIGQRAWKVFGEDLTALGNRAKGFYDGLVDGADKAIGWMIGAFLAFTRTVGIYLGNLPAFASEAMVNMANAVVGGLERLLNEFIGKINALGNAVEAIATALGRNIDIPNIPDVDWKGWEQRNTGAAVETVRRMREAAASAWSDGAAMWDAFKADVAREAVNNAMGDPGKPKKDREGRSEKEGVDEFARALDEFNDRMRERNALASEYERIVSRMPTGEQLANAEYAMLAGRSADDLGRAADEMAQLDRLTQQAAGNMASAFGQVGKAIGGMVSAMSQYKSIQSDAAARSAYALKAYRDAMKGTDQEAQKRTLEEYYRVQREGARETAAAQVDAYGSMASAAKGFFKEGSDGYKAMQAVEAGFRAWQMAMSIQAMVQDTTETSSKVANSMVKGGASAAAGAAKIFEALGPFGFPVVAAMLGVLASLGLNTGGGGSSGVAISERRQREQGTGTVLGDANAKSASIANALEIVAANTNRDLEYSNAMLRALRSIDDQIGVVAAAIARQLGASGILDTSSLNLGTSGKAPSLMTLGFGSVTTRTLKDLGLEFGSQSLADILANGIDGAAYSVVQSTKKKSALGITYSSSTSTKTKKTELDAALADEITRVIGSLRDGVLAAASVLGVSGAEAVLAAFKVNIGKISLKDMTGAEIEETLQAVFSKVGDEMAGAVLPGLKAVQSVGEGLFETLIRVARQYQVIDVTLSTIGKTFGMVGVSSIEARERLVDLFGSLDDFTEQVGFYSETFLTEAERLAPIQTAVTAELARLGLSGIKTRDQFKSVVQGLDVSTAAGAELFAALMALAPAFAKVTEETQAVTDAREALSRAYERESEAILDTKDRFAQLAADLGKFRSSLYSGPAAAMSPEAAYLAAQAEFARVRGLALGGNEQALGELQSVSQAYLDASKAYFASSQGYFADLEAVRAAVTAAEGIAGAQATLAEQQLEQLKSLVSGYIEVNESVLSVRDAVVALQTALGLPANGAAPAAPLAPSTQAANDNAAAQAAALDEIRQELAALNARMDAKFAQDAAIYAAERADLETQTEALARRLRDLTA